MKRIVDVLVAAAIVVIPALAIAQAPAAAVAASSTSHQYLAASLIKPCSAANPADPGTI